MALIYSYKINGARVTSEDGLADVVKEVEVTVTGTDGAAMFELPVVVKLGAPDAQSFTAFASLTKDKMINWIESSQTLEDTKAHIAFVVAKEKEKLAFESKPLPWSPALELPGALPAE